MISDFHFLRPDWLWGAPAAIVLLWAVSRREDLRARWGSVVAPHLLDHLIVGRRERRRFRPEHLTAAVMALAALALAGPTWEHETPPFVQDKAPLAIAIDLSRTMDAVDVSPSRLERAKLKVRDLLSLRAGARTALVAYAGSAHLVLPLTDDANLIQTYLDSLATELMPVSGKNTAAALSAAERALADEQTPGAILLVTDGVEAAAALKTPSRNNEIVILAVGTIEGGPVRTGPGQFLTDPAGRRIIARVDADALRRLKATAGASVVMATAGDADVAWIARHAQSHFERSQAEGETRWRDVGWWLTLPIAMLSALWFRRGWTIRWLGALAMLALVPWNAPAQAADWRFVDLWLTADQQGRIAFERGDYGKAGELFVDPLWRGVALYRAGRYAEAAEAFAGVNSAGGYFNQGDALAKQGKLEAAAAAFRQAVQLDPGLAAASANLELVQALLQKKKPEDDDPPNDFHDPEDTPDSVQVDEKGKRGVLDRIQAKQSSDMWMRNIATTPAQLLRRRFAFEAQAARR